MMKVSEALARTWAAVLEEGPQPEGCYHRRIPVQGPWPAHAGIHWPTRARLLILESDTQAIQGRPLQDKTKGYTVEVCPDEARGGDRVEIHIEEAAVGYGEIFTLFCVDIVEHWTPHASSVAAVNALARRLAGWKKFFQRGAGHGLSREEYIGLYGELSFIEAAFDSGVEAGAVVDGWQGPFGANQDFLFGPVAVEVKSTVGNDPDRVRIANARQLDGTGLDCLYLMHHAFDFREGSGRSLAELVASVRAYLDGKNVDIVADLNERLLAAGYVDGAPDPYGGWGFTRRKLEVFDVVADFPRLLESQMPPGISEVAYTLNLGSATRFIVAEDQIWARMGSSDG